MMTIKTLHIISSFILLAASINAQVSDFKEFINKGDSAINSEYELCEEFFGKNPFDDMFDETEYSVLLKHENFTAVLFKAFSIEGFGESAEVLTIYDWNGNMIDDMEFGYERGGEYLYEGLSCDLDDDLKIECAESIEEGDLVEIFNENGEFAGYQYETVRSSVDYYEYKISEEGKITEVINSENE